MKINLKFDGFFLLIANNYTTNQKIVHVQFFNQY